LAEPFAREVAEPAGSFSEKPSSGGEQI